MKKKTVIQYDDITNFIKYSSVFVAQYVPAILNDYLSVSAFISSDVALLFAMNVRTCFSYLK